MNAQFRIYKIDVKLPRIDEDDFEFSGLFIDELILNLCLAEAKYQFYFLSDDGKIIFANMPKEMGSHEYSSFVYSKDDIGENIKVNWVCKDDSVILLYLENYKERIELRRIDERNK
jgi:hypothetical protein